MHMLNTVNGRCSEFSLNLVELSALVNFLRSRCVGWLFLAALAVLVELVRRCVASALLVEFCAWCESSRSSIVET